MVLKISLNQLRVLLQILKNKKVIDTETVKYYHDLSEVLISTLDKLLKKNNIDIKSLKSYKIQGNLGQDSTSYKIVQAFVAGLKY